MTQDKNNPTPNDTKKRSKRELLNVLKMYSPAVIALNDVFFGKKKDKEDKSSVKPTELKKKYI